MDKNIQPDWEKRFDELFYTGIGGVTTHVDSERQPYETKQLIKQFISQERESEYQRGKKETEESFEIGIDWDTYEAGRKRGRSEIKKDLLEWAESKIPKGEWECHVIIRKILDDLISKISSL